MTTDILYPTHTYIHTPYGAPHKHLQFSVCVEGLVCLHLQLSEPVTTHSPIWEGWVILITPRGSGRERYNNFDVQLFKNLRTKLLVLLWYSHGAVMVQPRYGCDAVKVLTELLVLLWYSYGEVMVQPWYGCDAVKVLSPPTCSHNFFFFLFFFFFFFF